MDYLQLKSCISFKIQMFKDTVLHIAIYIFIE